MKNIFKITLFLGCLLISKIGLGHTLYIINDTLWAWTYQIKLAGAPPPKADHMWSVKGITLDGGKKLSGVEAKSGDKRKITGVIPPYSKGTISHKYKPGLGALGAEFGLTLGIAFFGEAMADLSGAEDSGYCWKYAKAKNRYDTKIDLIKSKLPKRPISKCADVYIVIKPKGGKEDQFDVVRYDSLNPVYKGHWQDYWNKNQSNMEKKLKKLNEGYVWYRGKWAVPVGGLKPK